MTATPIAFIDLKAQQAPIRQRIEARLRAVLDHGKYIMGPEVAELEESLAAYTGAREVITCSSGTDALWLPLLALEIGAGDAVFVPSYTFTATAEAVALCGATPVFVDVDPDQFNMDAASLKDAIATVVTAGKLTPRAVIPVDLFGIPAPYDALAPVARAHGLSVIADAAQSFGGAIGGQRVGTLAGITATSFFPAKPLGCYGDGGAIFTADPEFAEIIRSIRIHGRGGQGKYDNVRVGTNARLDTMQAAVLLEKLSIFDSELAARQRIAEAYAAGLGDVVTPPAVPAGVTSAWAQYTIKTDRREALAEGLKEKGVPTQIYYPKPLHVQAPYKDAPIPAGGLPVTEALSKTLISLPMHPYLTSDVQDRIIQAVIDVLG
ncbi:MAG: DegT/DnrJ/EryC1/StrS family aminotransferase [Alphaproteobacteria bacterium]